MRTNVAAAARRPAPSGVPRRRRSTRTSSATHLVARAARRRPPSATPIACTPSRPRSGCRQRRRAAGAGAARHPVGLAQQPEPDAASVASRSGEATIARRATACTDAGADRRRASTARRTRRASSRWDADHIALVLDGVRRTCRLVDARRRPLGAQRARHAPSCTRCRASRRRRARRSTAAAARRCPGKILAVRVAAGERGDQGRGRWSILEAMKMEHEVRGAARRRRARGAGRGRAAGGRRRRARRRSTSAGGRRHERRARSTRSGGDAAWITLNQPERRNALSDELVDGPARASARRRSPTRRCASSSSPAPAPAFCAGADLKSGGVGAADGAENPFVTVHEDDLGRAEAGDRPHQRARLRRRRRPRRRVRPHRRRRHGRRSLQRGARRRHPGDDLGRRASRSSASRTRCGSSSPASASPPRAPSSSASIHRAVPAAELDAAVDEVVGMIRLGGPNAVREAKQLVRRVPTLSMDDGFRVHRDEDRRAVRVRRGGRGHAARSSRSGSRGGRSEVRSRSRLYEERRWLTTSFASPTAAASTATG